MRMLVGPVAEYGRRCGSSALSSPAWAVAYGSRWRTGLHTMLRRGLAGDGERLVAEWESQIEVGSDGWIAESSWPVIERWARAGEPEAMVLYGARLVHLGVAGQALPWLRRAVEAGVRGAAYNLGVCYEVTGDGVAARDVWRGAADTGDADAMLGLVRLCLAEGDVAGALVWYEPIIAADDLEMLLRLAVALRDAGEDEAAIRPLRVAIEHGDAWGMTYYASILQTRGQLDEALSWHRRAADLGNGRAAFEAGALLLERGDRAGAEVLLEQGARAGEVRAIANLGAMRYEAGDLAAAEELFRAAAARGNPVAIHNLGTLLRDRGEVSAAAELLIPLAQSNDPVAASL